MMDIAQEVEKLSGAIPTETETAIVTAISTRLREDSSADVHSGCVRAIAGLARCASAAGLASLCSAVLDLIASTDPEVAAQRDLYAIGLRTAILQAPATMHGRLVEDIFTPLLALASQDPPAQVQAAEESVPRYGLEILADFVKQCIGVIPETGFAKAARAAQRQLQSSCPAIAKRAVRLIGVCGPALPNDELHALVGELLKAIGTQAARAQFVAAVSALSAVTSAVGWRLREHAPALATALLSAASTADEEDAEDGAFGSLLGGGASAAHVTQDELREACCQALAELVRACPDDLGDQVAPILALAHKLALHDPNFNYDVVDEALSSGDDSEGDWSLDDDDEFDGYEDGLDAGVDAALDSTWRSRRAAVQLLGAWLELPAAPLLDSQLAPTLAVLITATRDREPMVRTPVLQVLGIAASRAARHAGAALCAELRKELGTALPAAMASAKLAAGFNTSAVVAALRLIQALLQAVPEAGAGAHAQGIAQLLAANATAVHTDAACAHASAELLRTAAQQFDAEALTAWWSALTGAAIAAIESRSAKLQALGCAAGAALAEATRVHAAALDVGALWAAIAALLQRGGHALDASVRAAAMAAAQAVAACWAARGADSAAVSAMVSTLSAWLSLDIAQVSVLRALAALVGHGLTAEKPAVLLAPDAASGMMSAMLDAVAAGSSAARTAALQACLALVRHHAGVQAQRWAEVRQLLADTVQAGPAAAAAVLALRVATEAVGAGDSAADMAAAMRPAFSAIAAASGSMDATALAAQELVQSLVMAIAASGTPLQVGEFIRAMLAAAASAGMAPGALLRPAAGVSRVIAGAAAGDAAAFAAEFAVPALRAAESDSPDQAVMQSAPVIFAALGYAAPATPVYVEHMAALAASLCHSQDVLRQGAAIGLGGCLAADVAAYEREYKPLLEAKIEQAAQLGREAGAAAGAAADAGYGTAKLEAMGAVQVHVLPLRVCFREAPADAGATLVPVVAPTLAAAAQLNDEGVVAVVASALAAAMAAAPAAGLAAVESILAHGWDAPAQAAAALTALSNPSAAAHITPRLLAEAVAACNAPAAGAACPDPTVSTAALAAVAGAVRSLPHDVLAASGPAIVDAAAARLARDPSLVKVVDLGPFKHHVDRGLPVRRAALGLANALLASMPDLATAPAVVAAVVSAVQDPEDDIVLGASAWLAGLATSRTSSSVVLALRQHLTPLAAGITAAFKAVAKDERQAADGHGQDRVAGARDRLRSLVRTLASVHEVAGAGAPPAWVQLVANAETQEPLKSMLAAARTELGASRMV